MFIVDSTKWLLLATIVNVFVALQFISGQQQDNIVKFNGFSSRDNEQIAFNDNDATARHSNNRQGKNLLNWIGLGTGPEIDPYLARTNAACLQGDLAECFKSHALNTFEEFFAQDRYDLTSHARVIRLPTEQLRSLAHEPYEYSSEPRAEESEWDHLVKYALRKVERFLKSTAIEVQFPDDVTENGRYSPRFVDEIADEIDILEDKKDTLFSRKRLRKLFIPFLIILKIFKLKLLLFLPLILGLASFKKFLAFLAIIIPGIIGFLKLCKPDLGHSSVFGTNVPQYAPNGLGIYGNYAPQHHIQSSAAYYPGESNYYGHHGGASVSFREDPHNLAYSAYRSAKSSIKADGDSSGSVKPKKSILPDS